MRRRDLVGGAAAVGGLLLAASAAAQRTTRIAWLTTGPAFPVAYFDRAMAELGWVEGRNLVIDRRVSGPDARRRAEIVDELIATAPDLIVAGGTTDALPLGAASRSVPIVVVAGTDLVEVGLVERLARPGRNVTGLTVIGRELDAKRLELVREIAPSAQRVSLLAVADQPKTIARVGEADQKARAVGIEVVGRVLDGPADLREAFSIAAADGDGAVLVPFNAITFENRPAVIAAAESAGIPAVYEFREYVADGGLISYGAVLDDYCRRAAALVDKILKGASPAELPVEQPTRFELVVNAGAARRIRAALPGTILARADEVIE